MKAFAAGTALANEHGMRGWRGVVPLLAASALAGCYRSRDLSVHELTRIEPRGERGLTVHRAGTQPLIFDSYDTVKIETPDDTGYAFERPVSARLEPGLLVVKDAHAERRFALEEVEAIEVSEHAPDRPWIIAGATVGAMVLGGALGYASVSCGEGEDFCGLGRGAAMLVGMTLGTGLGLGISIPVTSGLGSDPSSRRPSRHSDASDE
jgi:hypothetical protein